MHVLQIILVVLITCLYRQVVHNIVGENKNIVEANAWHDCKAYLGLVQ
uniref:Uncharacterized protein n=1 Tax=Anguilla anguilla TaxID=7936 RepID=A0A0E9XVE5_ANGAN